MAAFQRTGLGRSVNNAIDWSTGITRYYSCILFIHGSLDRHFTPLCTGSSAQSTDYKDYYYWPLHLFASKLTKLVKKNQFRCNTDYLIKCMCSPAHSQKPIGTPLCHLPGHRTHCPPAEGTNRSSKPVLRSNLNYR